ncbi:hypothetical protein DESA109040_05845 [Deinococcus saxicola]
MNPNLKPWRATDILSALYAASHGKCAYCEVTLGTADAMEVDHLVPKSIDPTLAATWANLIPSCHHCNNHKSTYDSRNGFINPFSVEPRDHLFYEHGRFYPRTDHGYQFLSRLQINRRTVREHAALWDTVAEDIGELYTDLQELEAGRLALTTRRSTKFRAKALTVLYAATPEAEYSAAVASRLLVDRHWPSVESLLRKHAIWDAVFTQYLAQAQAAALLL